MTPFYFGRSDRQIFGIYDPPAEGRPVLGAVVLCQPLGTEYINAHRAVRQLAVMLSDAGFHTLRFDYYGTGDSGGESETIELDDLVADIGLAVDELSSMSGFSRVRLVGLRIGAPLVIRSAALLPDRIEAVVLWDPLISGANHIEEFARDGRPQKRKRALGLWPPFRRVDDIDLDRLCFSLSATMASQIRSIELRDLAHLLPKETFVVTTGPSEERDAVWSALGSAATAPASVENYPSFPCWNEDWPVMVAAVPVNALTRIVGWMKGV